jgi:RND superfamily putative drug exporter
MAAWTRLVLRHRRPIVAGWLVVVVLGLFAVRDIHHLLANTFTVPGTDSERARLILEREFGDRGDGEFLIVFRGRGLGALPAAMRRAAAVVPTAGAGPIRRVAPDVAYGTLVSRLALADAKGYTDDVLRAVRPPPGVRAYVTGPPAIQQELDPILAQDLHKGEAIALPIAFAVLVVVFGISLAVTLPLFFAAATIMGTLAIVWISAHFMTTSTYATNLVELIGLGIAVDYSLLVVYRFREELAQVADVDDAVVRTMQTAGRSVLFSGGTVAIGLALLLFIPLPFVRSLGIAGFTIPLVSLAAALTLQPVLLSLYGRRGTRARRLGLHPGSDTGFWHRLAGSPSISPAGLRSSSRRRCPCTRSS